MSRDVFILGGKRTPMAGYIGALKDVSAIDLGASAARSAMEATEVSPEEINHTIFGNALQTSGNAALICERVQRQSERKQLTFCSSRCKISAT